MLSRKDASFLTENKGSKSSLPDWYTLKFALGISCTNTSGFFEIHMHLIIYHICICIILMCYNIELKKKKEDFQCEI